MTNLTPLLPISEANSAALLQTLTAEKTRRSTENRLAYYEPCLKQLEFHTARQRLADLVAGHQQPLARLCAHGVKFRLLWVPFVVGEPVLS